MFRLSKRSFDSLSGVDPRLSVVFGTAIQSAPHDFVIIEGLRSKERQRELVDARKSWTMNSRHLTGHAVDVAIWHEGDVSWDLRLYDELAPHIKRIAEQHGVDLEWGGDWSVRDAVHWQIPWKVV